MLQIGIKNITDVNVPPAFNIIYSNQNELQQIQIKNKHSSKKNSNNLNLSNNISKENIDSKSQSQSLNVSYEKEEDNLLPKISSSYNLGEGETSFQINNFNDNPSNEFKKSRTYKEQTGNDLKFQYNINNNQQNRFEAVLETINEVSSIVDSSELSDDDENNDVNKNKNNNEIVIDNGKIKGGTNDNIKKKKILMINK